MITARLIQAIELGLTELHDEFTSETDATEAIAEMGVGPRALGRLVDHYAEVYGEAPEIGFASAFLVGMMTERLALSATIGAMSEEEVLTIISQGEEPYDEAPVEDMQDTLQMLYGIDTPDGISMSEVKLAMLEALEEDPNLGLNIPEDIREALTATE